MYSVNVHILVSVGGRKRNLFANSSPFSLSVPSLWELQINLTVARNYIQCKLLLKILEKALARPKTETQSQARNDNTFLQKLI